MTKPQHSFASPSASHLRTDVEHALALSVVVQKHALHAAILQWEAEALLRFDELLERHLEQQQRVLDGIHHGFCDNLCVGTLLKHVLASLGEKHDPNADHEEQEAANERDDHVRSRNRHARS